MNAKWTWVIGIVGIASLVLGIVIPIEAIPQVQVGTLVLGIVIGLIVGAIACVFVFFGRRSGGMSRQ